MSEEIMETTEEEVMKALGEFATICYNKGAKDALIGVGIGAAVSALIIFGIETVDIWKDKIKLKRSIKEFEEYVTKEES